MYAALLRFRAWGCGPSPARRSLFGKYGAEAKVVGQVQKRFHVMLVGPHLGLAPTPYGVTIGLQTGAISDHDRPDSSWNRFSRFGKSAGTT